LKVLGTTKVAALVTLEYVVLIMKCEIPIFWWSLGF